MGAVEDKVRELIEMLDSGLEQYKSYAEDMHRLNALLEKRGTELEIKRGKELLNERQN